MEQQNTNSTINNSRLKENSRIYKVKITPEERKRLIKEAKEKESMWGNPSKNNTN